MGYDSRMQTPRVREGIFTPRQLGSGSLGNLRESLTLPVSPRNELATDTNGNKPQMLAEVKASHRAGLLSAGQLPSVAEVVNRKEDFGIDGYFIPNFNAALDKPRECKFSPTKDRKTFIYYAVKAKDFVPVATRYNTA